jgi:aspartate/methionine/tyrosine aminotransferase
MHILNPLAIALNQTLHANPTVLELLSKKGRGIYFPSKGILAQSAEAKGKEINATIGIALEDDETPMVLQPLSEKVKEKAEEVFNYASSFGKPELRKVWLEKIFEKNPSLQGKTLSQPIVTNALTHALSVCGYLFLEEGDAIITPDLFWDNYTLLFENAYGAVLKCFPTFQGQGFNVDGFQKIVHNQPGDKIVTLLNFPNNPSGYTPTISESRAIADVLIAAATRGKKVLALIDDAYFGLVYEEGIFRESIFTLLCDAHPNLLAVKIDGATKEDYAWGLRVGFITFGIQGGTTELYTALEKKTAGVVRGSISNVPHISQSLLYRAYTDPRYAEEKKKKYTTLQSRYEKVKQILTTHPEYQQHFEALPFNSGYFLCLSLKNANPEKVRQHLLQKYSTGVLAFESVLRLAFSATPISKLETLFDRIYKTCLELQ